MKIKVEIENGIYNVSVCTSDTDKKVGEIVINSKRNEFCVLTPKNDKRTKEEIESSREFLYNAIIKRIATRPYPDMVSGETKPYALTIIKNIALELNEPVKEENSEDLMIKEMVKDIKLCDKGLMPENRVLR